jgi:hypothetical protein
VTIISVNEVAMEQEFTIITKERFTQITDECVDRFLDAVSEPSNHEEFVIIHQMILFLAAFVTDIENHMFREGEEDDGKSDQEPSTGSGTD